MSEAKRRGKSSKSGLNAAFIEGMKAVTSEAQGVWEILVFHSRDVHRLSEAALTGDLYAQKLVQTVVTMVGNVAEATRSGDPAICLCCPREVHHGKFVICLTIPYRDDPTRAIGSVICEQCSADEVGLEARIVANMKPLLPDARAITLVHEAGHA